MAVDQMSINLNHEEVLILFEFISREIDILKYQHQAEQVVLNKIKGQIEKTVTEPFQKDYLEIIDDARKKILDQYNGSL